MKKLSFDKMPKAACVLIRSFQSPPAQSHINTQHSTLQRKHQFTTIQPDTTKEIEGQNSSPQQKVTTDLNTKLFSYPTKTEPSPFVDPMFPSYHVRIPKHLVFEILMAHPITSGFLIPVATNSTTLILSNVSLHQLSFTSSILQVYWWECLDISPFKS